MCGTKMLHYRQSSSFAFIRSNYFINKEKKTSGQNCLLNNISSFIFYLTPLYNFTETLMISWNSNLTTFSNLRTVESSFPS